MHVIKVTNRPAFYRTILYFRYFSLKSYCFSLNVLYYPGFSFFIIFINFTCLPLECPAFEIRKDGQIKITALPTSGRIHRQLPVTYRLKKKRKNETFKRRRLLLPVYIIKNIIKSNQWNPLYDIRVSILMPKCMEKNQPFFTLAKYEHFVRIKSHGMYGFLWNI